MYTIRITPKAISQLKNIKENHKNALAQTIEDLKENPFLGKPLEKDLKGKYSYRVGVYRIIYVINQKDKKINIISAGHRSIIYN